MEKSKFSDNQKSAENKRSSSFWDDADLKSSERSYVVSAEAAKSEHAKCLQSKITPELLKFFNREQASALVEYFDSTPSTSTSDGDCACDLSSISEKARRFLANEFQGRKIIEFGNKGYKNINCDDTKIWCNVPAIVFLKLGARSYEGCDPKYNTDGLTFLLRQPDESAIVTSFGVLEMGVLHLYGRDDLSVLLSKYTAELGRQIYRVTPKDAITLHGLDSCLDLENAGFVIEEAITKELERRNVSGELVVLRKK